MSINQRAQITTCVPKDKLGPNYATCRITPLSDCLIVNENDGSPICEISTAITMGV